MFVYSDVRNARAGEEPVVAEMQEMSGSICKNTNMWGTGTSDDARIYDNLGEDGNNPLLAAGTDTVGISSFLLTDNRDQKDYKVRRLADGNCWMAQNLDLDLSTIGTLTSSDTDLNSKESWTPDVETIVAPFDDVITARYRKNSDDSFYNQFAAVAESRFDNSGVADDSICPKGWGLPNGQTIYANLSIAYNGLIGQTAIAIPLNFTLPGYVNTDNILYMSGSIGHYWANTKQRFATIDNRYSPTNGGSQALGLSIRCLARD